MKIFIHTMKLIMRLLVKNAKDRRKGQNKKFTIDATAAAPFWRNRTTFPLGFLHFRSLSSARAISTVSRSRESEMPKWKGMSSRACCYLTTRRAGCNCDSRGSWIHIAYLPYRDVNSSFSISSIYHSRFIINFWELKHHKEYILERRIYLYTSILYINQTLGR